MRRHPRAAGAASPGDELDRRLIVALSRDGRRSAADLAQELGLSRQALAGRLRGLERAGLVRGYRADLDRHRLGLDVRAWIRLQVDGTQAARHEQAVKRALAASPFVRAVYHVTGEDCYVVDVVCRRIDDVTALLADLKRTRAVHSSRTAFVLETVLERGTLGAVDAALLAPAASTAAPPPAVRPAERGPGRRARRRTERPAGGGR